MKSAAQRAEIVILATPLVAYAMAYYMHLGFKPNSPVQYPERLYRQRKLMLIVSVTSIVCTLLLFARFDSFREAFHPTVLDSVPPPSAEAIPIAE